MKIQVTQEDIDKGAKFDSRLCPVALACLRVTGMDWYQIFTRLTDDVFSLQPQLKVFMQEFDKGNHVEPFEFEFQLPGLE